MVVSNEERIAERQPDFVASENTVHIHPDVPPAFTQFAHRSLGWIVHASKLADVGCFVQLARDHSTLDLAADIACESEFWIQQNRGSSKRAVPDASWSGSLSSGASVTCVELPDLCAPARVAVSKIAHTFAFWEQDFGASASFLPLAAQLESSGLVVQRTDASAGID
ncbi:hypothetical protein BLNAU_21909 [Blattamonas nauphoetae]|uniref:Uncharacterized protein n=1 Tax=Blattamonas nauphoetae TaxID=2049346 RepID=A0ABQ9WXQ8_9EUKA|nr:hypothetical protein BLNAU_21909 [Blattamonas nauphoetae]